MNNFVFEMKSNNHTQYAAYIMDILQTQLFIYNFHFATILLNT